MKTAILLTIIALALASIAYTGRNIPFMFRAYNPLPVDYLSRLRMLEGWPVEQGDGLNCSGFVSNAHSARFRTASDIYHNTQGDLTLVVELTGFRELTRVEQFIQPGALASFAGPKWNTGRAGVHVAAYLGNGVWIDADGRRGDVRRFQLHEKSASDYYFAGRVRLYEWARPEQFSINAAYNTLGRDDRTP